MRNSTKLVLICLAACLSPLASAFLQAPRPAASISSIIQDHYHPSTIRNTNVDHRFWSSANNPHSTALFLPKSLINQRKSVAAIQTCGLFGLGFGEIAVVLVVVGFVLGPQNIGKIISASSTRAADLSEGFKQIPEEFQKGMEEGESDVRARTAKRIKVISEEDWNKEEGK